MLFEPGPLPQLTGPLAPIDLIPEDPGFGPLVMDMLSDLPLEESAMADLLAVMADAATDDPGGIIDAALVGADAELATQTVDSYLGDTTQITADSLSGSEMLTNAITQTPAEAWQPVPEPNWYSPTPQVPTGANPLNVTAIVPGNPDPTIVDIFRGGQRPAGTDPSYGLGPHLEVGDQLQLTINSAPQPGGGGTSAGLVITATLTNWATPETRNLTLGTTDPQGFLMYTLATDDSWIGDWSATLYTDDGTGPKLGTVTFFEIGNPQPAGRLTTPGGGSAGGSNTPQPVQPVVTLTNKGGGPEVPSPPADPNSYYVGDVWALHIVGAPNAPIVLSASKNGVDQGQVTIGTTDDLGQFDGQGVMGPNDVGQYTETYIVGGVQWGGTINYTVSQEALNA